MASNSSAVDSKDSSMVKVRLEMEDTEKEARNPLRSSLTEERLSADHLVASTSPAGDSISNNNKDGGNNKDEGGRSFLGSLRLGSSARLEPVYAPDPSDAVNRKSVLLNVAGYILVTEFCERLAYYGFAGSLVLFFQTELGFTNAQADVQFSAWSGICYITPLLGGYIADTYLGRYKTILIFCCIYLVGLVMVVIGSVPGEVNESFFFPAIYIIALGTGGIKPNVSTMGADQFDERYSQDRLEMQSFFNWFYWMVNLGALIAYSVVAYFCQYGLPTAGGPKWGFFLGYMVPAVAMFIGIVIFIIGTPKYTLKRPAGSVLAVAVNVVYEACVRLYSADRPSTGFVLDKASEIHGGSYPDRTVQGVKYVARLLPFLIILVPFWGIYSQMSTAFQNQACQMDLRLGSGVNMPVSALNSFDTIAILILVPVFDRYLYPKIAQWLGRPVTMLEKIGAGLVFAILAMCVAAIVEAVRLSLAPASGDYYDEQARANFTPCQSIRDYDPYTYQAYLAGDNNDDASGEGAPLYCSQTCSDYYTDPTTQLKTLNLTCISCDDLPQMSNMSVFWQIPQFFLIGIAEILTSITSLEFFYSQAPTAMRSVSQSLNLATTALGSFLVIPLLLLVNNANPSQPWVPANLDEGHLSWYFTLLAGLMLLTLFCYIRLAEGYEYKTTAELSVLDDAEQTAPVAEHRRGLLSTSTHSNNNSSSQHGQDEVSQSPDKQHSSLHKRTTANNKHNSTNNNDSNNSRVNNMANRIVTHHNSSNYATSGNDDRDSSDIDASVASMVLHHNNRDTTQGVDPEFMDVLSDSRSQSLSSNYTDGPRFSADQSFHNSNFTNTNNNYGEEHRPNSPAIINNSIHHNTNSNNHSSAIVVPSSTGSNSSVSSTTSRKSSSIQSLEVGNPMLTETHRLSLTQSDYLENHDL